jgi:hypothetical protein
LKIFFSDVSLITLDALPSGARFNQKYFINNIIPDIAQARGRIFHIFPRRQCFVYG